MGTSIGEATGPVCWSGAANIVFSGCAGEATKTTGFISFWVLILAVKTKELKLDIDRVGTVSAILTEPAEPRACYVFAHGAGANMRHGFMEKVATGLAERGIATLRYNFPYMENNSR